MVALFDEFKSVKKKEKRKSYMILMNRKKKIMLKENGKKKMYELHKHILFFDFIENYYVSKNISKNNLNMVINHILLKKIKLLFRLAIRPLIRLLLTVKGLR